MLPMRLCVLGLMVVLLAGCGSDSSDQSSTGDWYHPPVAVTWQWQLQPSGELETSHDVALYDLDLFDIPATQIRELQQQGRKVICYFSAGSYENWRDDAGRFESADLGEALDDWEGERWLDIRSTKVRTIMADRLKLARDKGCDGVEPDNVDGYANASGFDLDYSDQLAFNRFLAERAHALGLAVALKNDLDQIEDLVTYFDFAVNEQCFEYEECDLLEPFIKAGKPVLNAEYKDEYVNDAVVRAAVCTQANVMQFSTLILPLDLDDSFRYDCRDEG